MQPHEAARMKVAFRVYVEKFDMVKTKLHPNQPLVSPAWPDRYVLDEPDQMNHRKFQFVCAPYPELASEYFPLSFTQFKPLLSEWSSRILSHVLGLKLR